MLWPLKIALELSDRPTGRIGLTVRLVVTLTPPLDAVRTTLVTIVTVPAVAVKEALVAP